MLRKTIEISSPGSRLSVRNAQLRVQRHEQRPIDIPIEDIGMLIVDDRQAVHTQAAFVEILKAGGTVLLTDGNHLPVGMLLPIEGHHAQTERHHLQIAASQPRRKRIWQALIRAKILLQAENLIEFTGTDAGLRALAGRVRSGDPDNFEAQAAQRYWPRLFDPSFRRNRDAPGINALLNYGYAIVRAAVARSIVASGLLPSLGIFHRNRRNPFCLADDLLEPYRPLVDWQIRKIVQGSAANSALEVREHRAALLGLLNRTVAAGDMNLPVQIAIERSASSLAGSLAGPAVKLMLPSSLPLRSDDAETES